MSSPEIVPEHRDDAVVDLAQGRCCTPGSRRRRPRVASRRTTADFWASIAIWPTGIGLPRVMLEIESPSSGFDRDAWVVGRGIAAILVEGFWGDDHDYSLEWPTTCSENSIKHLADLLALGAEAAVGEQAHEVGFAGRRSEDLGAPPGASQDRLSPDLLSPTGRNSDREAILVVDDPVPRPLGRPGTAGRRIEPLQVRAPSPGP